MQSPRIYRRTPRRPVAGEKVSFARTFTDGDVALFIGATWDVNPYHTDALFAAQTRFGKRIVPGLLTASLLTHIGGLWAFLATEMRFEFLAPVFIGDTITAQAEVLEVDAARGWVRLGCVCTNQKGKVVLRGEVRGYPADFSADE